MRVRIQEEKLDFLYNGTKVLVATVQYPVLYDNGNTLGQNVVNQYYIRKKDALWEKIRNELYPEAVQLYLELQKTGDSMRIYEVFEKATLTYFNQCVMSVYFDTYIYTGGAHGNTDRSSDTWNICQICRYQLEDFFPMSTDYRSMIESEIMRQIHQQQGNDQKSYFDDVETLVRQNFQDENFYITPDGVVIYFQQYAIAPYAAGMPEFLIPFGGLTI